YRQCALTGRPVPRNDRLRSGQRAGEHPADRPASRGDHGMTGITRSITGSIQYTSKQSHRMDAERGRESFRLDVHRDGSRVLAAHCEIDDAPAVVRDVNLRLDADNLPQECFVRIAVGGQFRGSGWFVFNANEAQCESTTTVEGRVSQRFPLQAPLLAF